MYEIRKVFVCVSLADTVLYSYIPRMDGGWLPGRSSSVLYVIHFSVCEHYVLCVPSRFVRWNASEAGILRRLSSSRYRVEPPKVMVDRLGT